MAKIDEENKAPFITFNGDLSSLETNKGWDIPALTRGVKSSAFNNTASAFLLSYVAGLTSYVLEGATSSYVVGTALTNFAINSFINKNKSKKIQSNKKFPSKKFAKSFVVGATLVTIFGSAVSGFMGGEAKDFFEKGRQRSLKFANTKQLNADNCKKSAEQLKKKFNLINIPNCKGDVKIVFKGKNPTGKGPYKATWIGNCEQ